MKVVIANRGEIAVRVLRTAREQGATTYALCTAPEQPTLAAHLADQVVPLPGTGAAAYLDIAAVLAAARTAGPGALVHPGYGFLSENAEFAAACAAADLVFVGPAPHVLRTFGDKLAARAAATAAGLPVLPATTAYPATAATPASTTDLTPAATNGERITTSATPTPYTTRAEQDAHAMVSEVAVKTTHADATTDAVHGQSVTNTADPELAAIAALLEAHPGGVMVKAAHGGGGRGQRIVRESGEVAEAVARCRAEALASCGDGTLYAEALAADARHIEVQVVGDGTQAVAVGDRDCGVQRRRQKLIEIAPAPNLDAGLRNRLHHDAARLVESVGLRGLATVEFLVTGQDAWFLEVNPRLQVEHTVTEETTGLDLVAVQLALARGATIGELGLPASASRGFAVQARVNAEHLAATGDLLPSTGTLVHFAAPTGAGVRVDTHARPGTRITPDFDALLAKVIARAPSYSAALQRCSDALAELVVSGVDTNAPLLRAVLAALADTGPVSTTWFEQHAEQLRAASPETTPLPDGARSADESRTPHTITPHDNEPDSGARAATVGETSPETAVLDDEPAVRSPMSGTVVALAAPGTVVPAGGEVAVLEAMKMQHVVRAEAPLLVARTLVETGTVVDQDTLLLTWTAAEHGETTTETVELDLDALRPDLAEVLERHRIGQDAARPDAVARRHRLGRRTARENIADLVDAGSFREYGALAIAAQRGRRNDNDLRANTPADGLIAGVATIESRRAAVLSYDYTVLAGTQGMRNHEKTDRILELAHEQRLPVVFFTEGGGGRPGDTDYHGVSGLEVTTFRAMGALSGRVPLIGIVSGRCFAGNAALLGICDVVIATPDANIGMGGPAMIEGGGLGVYAPEDIGPVEVQRRNGVVHIVARDEADAVAIARRYLAYFRPAPADWTAPDPRLARHVVPENRLRAYEVRAAIEAIVDVDSVLEVRADWGVGIVTALVRVQGRPLGLIANNGHHLGGAIDAPAAEKLSAFLRLCDAHDLPIVSLCDTPGFMVGPEAEREATVTKFARLFIDSAALTVPLGTVVLRKGYGLGAQAMAAGSFRSPRFVIAWPTGEIGGMGLEGAVRLGFRKQLEAIADPAERERTFQAMVHFAYANSTALNAAAVLELDDVIDPADTRRWITTLWDDC
ncbi:carboxyl transferase domain-containing protein [Nocardia sp. NPDC127579]|uniref:acetyl-CoA carboxylase family protein n=1 Tax=Nocardia sp. NPDC127579 TaxID=3345402 RepID=UPI003630E9DC